MSPDQPTVALMFDLLQDVNILWPLAKFVDAETNFNLVLMVSERFVARDKEGTWQKEVADLADATRASTIRFSSTLEAYSFLAGGRGLIVAGSESNLGAHATSHDLFVAAPPGYTRVTLQHGYECIGFLQNREQSLVFGTNVQFAADIVCSWMPLDRLREMTPSERSKLLVTGPTSLLREAPSGRSTSDAKPGLVCENLHSVRLNAAGDFKASYMDTFNAFSSEMRAAGKSIALRPHPGGQYVVRNAVPLPANVTLANEPMYKTDLSQFAYGISAPSSVLIDMVMAGIPTAVWQDPDGTIDTSAYEGLTRITSVDEWVAFAQAATADPAPFIERQEAFLAQSGILTDRAQVRRNFLELISGSCAGATTPALRVLLVALNDIATLQISFIKPLRALVEAGVAEILFVTEMQLRTEEKRKKPGAQQWFKDKIDAFRPDVAVYCRYSGRLAEWSLGYLKEHGVPTVFHIDDDLLNVPISIGELKYIEHNRPERIGALRFLLNESDLVYCSTSRLQQRLVDLGFDRRYRQGKIYCSTTVVVEAEHRPVRKLGYMGFSHADDFQLVVPALVQFMRERPEITFELFGTMPRPPELDEFGDRVTLAPPVRDYNAFLEHFASLQWDVGICPLDRTIFNSVKANTKWVEYSAVGTASIATSNMAYDECCSDECGILVENAADAWLAAFRRLADDPDYRYRLVRNAQARLRRDYTIDRLRRQVLDVFDEARTIHQETIGNQP
ncbi:glycosyltransferase family protein [Sphingomonas sp. RS6]